MTSGNRFKPPLAAVDAARIEPMSSNRPIAVLGVLTLLQAAWLGVWTPRSLALVSEGAMNASGPFLCVVGCVCLYAGLLRARSGAVRGRNLFVMWMRKEPA